MTTETQPVEIKMAYDSKIRKTTVNDNKRFTETKITTTDRRGDKHVHTCIDMKYDPSADINTNNLRSKENQNGHPVYEDHSDIRWSGSNRAI